MFFPICPLADHSVIMIVIIFHIRVIEPDQVSLMKVDGLRITGFLHIALSVQNIIIIKSKKLLDPGHVQVLFSQQSGYLRA